MKRQRARARTKERNEFKSIHKKRHHRVRIWCTAFRWSVHAHYYTRSSSSSRQPPHRYGLNSIPIHASVSSYLNLTAWAYVIDKTCGGNAMIRYDYVQIDVYVLIVHLTWTSWTKFSLKLDSKISFEIRRPNWMHPGGMGGIFINKFINTFIIMMNENWWKLRHDMVL